MPSKIKVVASKTKRTQERGPGREGVNDYFTAFGWTPEGRRARGEPKTTWRKSAEKKRNKAGWKI